MTSNWEKCWFWGLQRSPSVLSIREMQFLEVSFQNECVRAHSMYDHGLTERLNKQLVIRCSKMLLIFKYSFKLYHLEVNWHPCWCEIAAHNLEMSVEHLPSVAINEYIRCCKIRYRFLTPSSIQAKPSGTSLKDSWSALDTEDSGSNFRRRVEVITAIVVLSCFTEMVKNCSY